MVDIMRSFLESSFEDINNSKDYDKYAFTTIAESMVGNSSSNALVALTNFNNSGYSRLIDNCYNAYVNTANSIDSVKLNASLRAAALRPDIMAQSYTIPSMSFDPIKYFTPAYAYDLYRKITLLAATFAKNTDISVLNAAVKKMININTESCYRNIAISSLDNQVIDLIQRPISSPMEPVTAEFLNSYDITTSDCIDIRKETTLYRNVRSVISEGHETAVKVMNSLTGIRASADAKVVGLANRFIVETNRVITSIIRYVSSVYALHVQTVLKKLNGLLLLSANISSLSDPVVESVIPTIVSIDKNDIVAALKNGDNSVFEDISRKLNIYFGIMKTRDGFDDDDMGLSYDRSVYTDVMGAVQSISDGMNKILDYAEDYVDTYNNVAISSGLLDSLVDKFDPVIKKLGANDSHDTNKMNIGTCADELNDFGYNTKLIATKIHLVYDTLSELESKFCGAGNTEFNHLVSTQQICSLVNEKRPECDKITDEIADALISRLKQLIVFMNDHVNEQFPDEGDSFNTPIHLEAGEDFSKYALLADMKIYSECADLDMIDLQNAFYLESMRVARGLHKLYLEEELNNPSANQGGTDNTQNSGDQNAGGNAGSNDKKDGDGDKTKTGVVSDNSQETQGAKEHAEKGKAAKKGVIASILQAIAEFWKSMKAQFAKWFGKAGAANKSWLSQHKGYLLKRSYANVTLNTYPYHLMGADGIKKMITTVTSNVGTLNAQTMSELKSTEEISQKLFTMLPNDKAPWNETSQLKEYIGIYLKVGANKNEVVQISNGELKNLVVNNMVPYVENFANSFEPEIISSLDSLGSKLESVIQSYEGVASTLDSGESGAASGGTTTGNENTESNLSMESKAKFLNQMISDFRGKVLNTIRDIEVDYTKYLKQLSASEKAVVAAKANNENNNNAQNNAGDDGADTNNAGDTTPEQNNG